MTDLKGNCFPDLESKLTKRLHCWIAENARRVRDEQGYASIEFTLMEPGGDDDNTLVLEAKVEEKFLAESVSGRIGAVPFDSSKRIG